MTVVDIRVEGDQVLSAVECGDVSVLVAAPVGVTEDELRNAVSEAPRAIETYVEWFDEVGSEVAADV